MKKFLVCLTVFVFFLANTQAIAANVKETFESAFQAYQQGDYQKAIQLFEKAIETMPSFAPSYNYLGLAHKGLGTDPQELIWYFKEAIAIDPNYAEPHENLGKIYYSLSDFDKAEEHALMALKLKPDFVSAELSLGWIYLLGKSQPVSAIKYFDRALKKTDLPYAYFGLGMAYFMDHQNYRVLEMITTLRKLKEDKLAEELERMIRDKTYVPIAPAGEPLLGSIKKQGTLVSDELPDLETSGQKESMPVRLRSKRPSLKDSDDPVNLAEGASSAIERVKAMQRNQPSVY